MSNGSGSGVYGDSNRAIKERDALRAEIERLREFIRETMQLDRMPSEWMDVARTLTSTPEGK